MIIRIAIAVCWILLIWFIDLRPMGKHRKQVKAAVLEMASRDPEIQRLLDEGFSTGEILGLMSDQS